MEFELLGRQSPRDEARELQKMVGEGARLHLGNWVAREDQIVITPEKLAFRSSMGEQHARATGAS